MEKRSREPNPNPNETVGIDSVCEGEESPAASSRRNVPILMLLQGETVGKKYLITKPRMQIGRSPESDIVLPDYEVSRKHSLIVYDNIDNSDETPQCSVHDLSSKNGTFVNGKRVVTHQLRDKDIVTVGSAALGYYLKDEIEVKFDAQLFSLATIDSLTGVHNKYFFQRTFQQEFQRAFRSNTPLSLFFCDLDHFKQVNDTHGHLAGDFVLRKIGEILIRNMREYDIYGRYGGEEFTVALPATPITAAAQVAERLRKTVETYDFEHQETKIPITISIGVACSGPHTRTSDELLKRADDALFRAKEQGRNRVVADKPDV